MPIEIKVNMKGIKLPESTSVRDIIQAARAPYKEGAIVAILPNRKEVLKSIDKYLLKTNKGTIKIKLDLEKARNLSKMWKRICTGFRDLKVSWITEHNVSVGSFPMDLKPVKNSFFYNRWDVVFGSAGFDPHNTHIVFILDPHEGVYGAPEKNRGVFGKIIGGRHVLRSMDVGDVIESVEPVIEGTLIASSTAVAVMDSKLRDGDELFTYIGMKLNEDAPNCGEYLLTALERGTATVSDVSHAYVRLSGAPHVEVQKENVTFRHRSVVTVRNEGSYSGGVYIYKDDVPPSNAHSVVGAVRMGMELLDVAKENDKLTVVTQAKRVMTVGMTQAEAERQSSSVNMKQIRVGLRDDDAVIVAQKPNTTMEALKRGSLETLGIHPDKIVRVELYHDAAPRTCSYFQAVTGSLGKPIGSLEVYFKSDQLIVFKPRISVTKTIMPENTPKKSTRAGQVGVTNMAGKRSGLIGVRFNSNRKFGPTGERFNATNTIGQITYVPHVLKDAKEGETIYFWEVKKR